MKEINITNEILFSSIYLLIILFIGLMIKLRYQKKYPEYKYFVKGLLLKLVGVSAFCIVYLFYYRGGDTINYFLGSKAIANLLLQNFEIGWEVLLNTDSTYNNISSFNYETGYFPSYMWKSDNTAAVCRFSAPFSLISNNSFFATSFLVASLSYIGIWKIFRLFNSLYSGNTKMLAYIILFLPTLIFWGSGIMKDSYVLGATCWITYNFHQIFILRKKLLINSLFLGLNLFIILNTKAYVILSLIPGMLLWVNSAYLKNAKGILSKIITIPMLILFVGFGGFYAINNLSSLMGVYGDVDSAIEQAKIIQEDLLREEQYGNNNYELGEIDGSVAGMVTMAPVAIFTAIYRPLPWEIGSPMMVISVFENSILLIMTIFILFRVNPYRIIIIILSEPILLYSFVFSILFAFGVGIAGTNFGALVRYKVPLIPFYFPMIFLIYKINIDSKIKNNFF